MTGLSIQQWETQVKARRERALKTGKLHGMPVPPYKRDEWIGFYDLDPSDFELVLVTRDGEYNKNTFIEKENEGRRNLGDAARPGESLPVPDCEDIADHWWSRYDRILDREKVKARATSRIAYRLRKR